MTSKQSLRAYLAAGLGLLCMAQVPDLALAGSCELRSTEHRRSVLELYTSEGCNSCPPADLWLTRLRASATAQQVVPLAFHVDYWNQLGWVDRFSRPQFTQRQQRGADRNRASFVYTPQFLLDGKDIRPVHSTDAFQSRLTAIAQSPAQARISASVQRERPTQIHVSGEVHAAQRGAEAFIALYENNLRSAVARGENAGKTLQHDYVVRALIGPLRSDDAGVMRLDHAVALPADSRTPALGIAIFVQDPRSGTVLQATSMEGCL